MQCGVRVPEGFERWFEVRALATRRQLQICLTSTACLKDMKREVKEEASKDAQKKVKTEIKQESSTDIKVEVKEETTRKAGRDAACFLL